MRQQLRLRVLLPLAVLGLLGAGFGAYAFGQAPEPAPAPPPATTTTPAAAAGETDAAAWASRVNALCAQAFEPLEPAKPPSSPTPEELETFLAALIAAYDKFDQGLGAAGWPPGEKAALVALRAQSAEATRLARRALTAFRAGELQQLGRILASSSAADRLESELRRLGAAECGAGSAAFEVAQGVRAPRRKPAPAKALAWDLYFKRAVVVLFYTPRADLDRAAVLEARSAALSAGAGFIPVSVESNQDVAELADTYDVLEAPAVLVFTRGPRVAARFDRLVDRETIAQAIENALR